MPEIYIEKYTDIWNLNKTPPNNLSQKKKEIIGKLQNILNSTWKLNIENCVWTVMLRGNLQTFNIYIKKKKAKNQSSHHLPWVTWKRRARYTKIKKVQRN